MELGTLKRRILISFCQEMAFVAAISQVKNCNKIEKTFFAHVYQDFGLKLTLSQPRGQIMPTTVLWALSGSNLPWRPCMLSLAKNCNPLRFKNLYEGFKDKAFCLVGIRNQRILDKKTFFATSDDTKNKIDCPNHGLRTPNEGLNQRNLKIWADVADKIRFGSI